MKKTLKAPLSDVLVIARPEKIALHKFAGKSCEEALLAGGEKGIPHVSVIFCRMDCSMVHKRHKTSKKWKWRRSMKSEFLYNGKTPEY